jgi:hypothetical protein
MALAALSKAPPAPEGATMVICLYGYDVADAGGVFACSPVPGVVSVPPPLPHAAKLTDKPTANAHFIQLFSIFFMHASPS